MKKWIFAVFASAATLSRADTLVVPNRYANVDAPEGGQILAQSGRNRIQQVYDSSSFSSLPPAGVLIDGFSWREDQGGGGAEDVTFDSVEVRASTTSRTSLSLSPVLADNIGSDETVTRMSAPLRLTSVSNPTGPNAFSLTFSFDKPFYYNPASGNLLIDLIVYKGPANLGNVDITAHGEGIGLAIEGSRFNPDSQGVVTQFKFEAVPEPSCLMLFGIGGLVVFLTRRLAA